MRQAVDGAPAFVYNEHNNAHRAWPGTGANSPQRAQCPLRGADTEDTNVTKKKIGVLGAGTWGMALARMLCVSGNDVQVWSALPAEVENLSATRVHPNLPGMKIPEELQFTKSIEEVCTGKDVLLFAVPSVFVRSTTAKARPYIPDGQILAGAHFLDALGELQLGRDLHARQVGVHPCSGEVVHLRLNGRPHLHFVAADGQHPRQRHAPGTCTQNANLPFRHVCVLRLHRQPGRR